MASQKTMKAVQVEDFKKDLKLNEVPVPTIKPNQILIKQAFAAVNPADILSINGNYYATQKNPLPFTGGMEGSGEVVEVGKELESKFKVGDKVCFLGTTWAEYATADEKTCFKLSGEISLEAGACFFVNPLTVYAMAEQLKRDGHKSVVHSAGSSSLGKIFIRTMKEYGIKTVNLVRKDEYIKELKDLGADYVLNQTSENFEKEFKEVTQSLNCTKCYDAIGGKFTGRLAWLLPKKSTVTVYGALEGDTQVHVDFWAYLANQSTINGFWLSVALGEFSPEIVQKGFEKVLSSLHGSYGTKISKVFSLDKANEAVKHQEKNGSEGKVLLSSQNK